MRKVLNIINISANINKKLIFTYILLLLPALVIPAVLYYEKLGESIENVLTNNMYKMSHLVNTNIETYINDAEKITSAPYYSNEMQDTLKNLKYKVGIKRSEAEDKLFNTIDVLLGLRKDIVGIYIFDDTNNKYYKTSVGDITPLYYFVEQPWFKKVKMLNGERLIIPTHKADYFVSKYPKYVFSVASSIISRENKEQIGVICVDMNLEVIKNTVSKFMDSENNELYIIDSEKNIIYSSDEIDLGRKFNKEWMPDPDNLESEEGQFIKYIGGRKNLVTYYHSKSIGWWYVTVNDLDSLIAANTNGFKKIIIIFTIAMLVTLAILSILMSNTITRPIKKLQTAMKRSKDGDFKTVDGVHSKDEIGQLVTIYNSMVNKISELINTVYKVTIKEKEAQLNALQTQINPHFLYNTLNSISCIAQVKGVEDIMVICKALSDLFRYSIKAGNQMVTLKEELKSIRDYMTIQSIRYENKIEVIYNIHEEAMNCKILKLTLQPIVENAIYHGLEPKRGKGLLMIEVEETDNESIVVSITDNGIGMDEAKLNTIRSLLGEHCDSSETSDKVSVGFKNVHDRIILYFGNQYGLRISSTIGIGTNVKICLPLSKH